MVSIIGALIFIIRSNWKMLTLRYQIVRKIPVIVDIVFVIIANHDYH